MATLQKAASVWSRYTKATQPANQRLIGLSVGEVGTRKTSFWLEAPGPILVQSFDKGLEGVVERYQDDKDIYVAEYDWSPTDDVDDLQEQAEAICKKFSEDYYYALEHGIRSILWDKEGDGWNAHRYAEFGAPTDNPRNFDRLNQRYRKLVNAAKDYPVNLGCIQGLRDEWATKINQKTGKEGGKPTGNRIPQGFGELSGLVHLNLFHRREKNDDPSIKTPVFWIDCGKARGPGGFDVQEQSFPDCTFVEFARLVFPDSKDSDWV